MLERNVRIKMLLCFVCIAFSLTGCMKTENSSGVSENDMNFRNDDEIENESAVSENTVDSIDYNDYLRKTWVVESWECWSWTASFSFYFTRIEDNIVEGKFAWGSDFTMGIPDFYACNWKSRLGDFAGVIRNGEVQGVFIETSDYGNGWRNGNLTIKFIDADKLEVTIDYIGEENVYGKKLVDETLNYIPYNISHYEGVIDPDETRKYPVDLDSWGKVNFTMLWTDDGVSKSYRMCFLTDEQDNILYRFEPLSDWVNFQNVIIEDLNGDGLKDIRIWEELESYDITFEWFQGEDGLFYNSFLNPHDHSIEYGLYTD